MLTSLRQRFPWRLSHLAIAVTLSILLMLWLLSGEKRSARETPPEQQVQAEQQLAKVETRWSDAKPFLREQVVQGSVLAWQQVDVQAQVAGRVEQLLKQQGDLVDAGAPLLQLSDEGRSQRLAQARAEVRLRQIELEGARALKKDNFVSQTELKRMEAELERADAELAAAELAVEYNRPKAPFIGRVDRRHVEVGQHVQAGDALMTLVDASRLKITGQIPQQHASAVKEGQPVQVTLLDGRQLQGEVRFISHAADPATRSFYVEVHAPNPQLWRAAGASATLHIQLPPVNAHRMSPALLNLDNGGQLGVHAVDDSGVVIFHPVQLVGIDGESASVSGMPDRVRVITQGAGFVRPGQQVLVAGSAE